MYRGSRLAASFLLILTGFAAGAVALFVVPPAATGAAGWLIPVGLAFAIGHWAALVGISGPATGAATWPSSSPSSAAGWRSSGPSRSLTGAHPFGAGSAAGPGLVAWGAALYTLLGIVAGRVPVVARLSPIERRRAVFGPSFAGIVR